MNIIEVQKELNKIVGGPQFAHAILYNIGIGKGTKTQLVSATGLDDWTVQKALDFLVSQNCIDRYEEEEDKE